MRKIFCLLLAVLLLASPGVFAAAEEKGTEENTDAFVIDRPDKGFHFVLPENYRNLNGSLDLQSKYPADGVLQTTLSYFAVPEEDFDAYNDYSNKYFDALVAGEEPPESPDPRWMTDRECAYLYDLFTIDANRGEAELRAILKENNGVRGDDFAWLENLGSDGEFSFFCGQYAELETNREEYREIMGEEYFHEFEELADDRETFLNALTLSAPGEKQKVLETDDLISFATTDLDGNPVDSKDLFAESKVTMINLWATWCHPCKKELPQLNELAKEFEKNGCRIVGICQDADEEDMVEEAKAILEEKGVDYLNLTPPEGVEDLLPSISLPTSFFFDSEGRMIVEPVSGAHVEEYLPALNAALAKLGAE